MITCETLAEGTSCNDQKNSCFTLYLNWKKGYARYSGTRILPLANVIEVEFARYHIVGVPQLIRIFSVVK